jgi:uncharacterized protein
MNESPDLSPLNTLPEPQPEPETKALARIPNIGNALLFTAFAAFLLIAFQLILVLTGKIAIPAQGGTITITHPKIQLAAQGAPYLITLIAAWFFYPILWRRSFLDGISWHWSEARRQASRLIPLGLLLGALSASVDFFLTPPKTPLIDDFFLKPSDAWLLTFFGTTVAPIFEEICFRGFLVPAFAIAYDWLSLSRTPEAHERWRSTTSLTPAALIFSAILSSVLFSLIHGEQVGFARGTLTVLFTVSLVLTFVRIKTQSVAASAIVHSAYNSLIFLITLFATGGYRHLDRLSK